MNKFFKTIFPVPAFLFLVFSVQSANGQGILREIINRMDNHYKRLATLKADVERAQVNPQLDSTDLYAGKIVMKPGKGREFALRLDWSKPKVEILSIVRGKYVLFVPHINRAYFGSSDSKKAKTSGGGNALSALSMSEGELRANFTPTFIGEPKLKDGTLTAQVRLTPKTRQNFKLADVWIDADGMPRQVMITALNGDTDTFFFSNIKKNDSIDVSIFTVNVGNADRIEQ